MNYTNFAANLFAVDGVTDARLYSDVTATMVSSTEKTARYSGYSLTR